MRYPCESDNHSSPESDEVLEEELENELERREDELEETTLSDEWSERRC